MSLLTIAEYKALPYYRSTQSDALINALLPDVEADFLAIRGMAWRNITGDLTNASATISDVSSLAGIGIGQLVDGSNVRGLIVSIDRDAGTVTLDTDATGDAADQALTVYPAGCRLIAARMVQFHIDEAERDPALSAESIADHRTEADGERIMGYPMAVVGGIQRFGGFGR